MLSSIDQYSLFLGLGLAAVFKLYSIIGALLVGGANVKAGFLELSKAPPLERGFDEVTDLFSILMGELNWNPWIRTHIC